MKHQMCTFKSQNTELTYIHTLTQKCTRRKNKEVKSIFKHALFLYQDLTKKKQNKTTIEVK